MNAQTTKASEVFEDIIKNFNSMYDKLDALEAAQDSVLVMTRMLNVLK